MKACFEFLTTRAGGLAHAGVVSGAADSLVNTADLLVDPTRLEDGVIAPKDPITVWCISEGARFEVFRGVVSGVRRDGANFRIQSATLGAVAMVDQAPPRSWANTTARAILQDLLSMSRISLELLACSPTLSDKFLHVWNTDGGSVADEIRVLLNTVAPGLAVLGSLDGRTLIGTREDIARCFPPMLYPFDQSVGETDTEITRFPLRFGMPGMACTTVGDAFAGTLSVVRHVIAPGQAYTDLVLDDTPDEGLVAWLGEEGQGEIPLEFIEEGGAE